MKFPYVRYGIFYRPVIPITLQYLGKDFTYEALIDTGADISILPAIIAEQLDIELKAGKTIRFGGITGTDEGYLHHINIIIGGTMIRKVPIVFTEHISSESYGILGHEGLFDKLKLTFEYNKKEIELTPKTYRG